MTWLLLFGCTTAAPDPNLQVLRDGCDLGIVTSCVDLGSRQWDVNRHEGRAAYTAACKLGHEVSCAVVREE